MIDFIIYILLVSTFFYLGVLFGRILFKTEKMSKEKLNEAYLQGAKDFNKYVKGSGTNTFNLFWKKTKQR